MRKRLRVYPFYNLLEVRIPAPKEFVAISAREPAME
jgi:hypothetical protein